MPLRFASFALTLSLIACSDGGPSTPPPSTKAPTGPPAAWKGEDISKGGSKALVLDRMEAEFTFPATNMPSSMSVTGTFDLEDIATQKRGNSKWYTAAIPFDVPEAERRFKPKGMKVFANNTELSFSTAPAERASPRSKTWRFGRKGLAIAFPEQVTTVRVEHPEAAKTMRRVNWSTAKADGVSKEDFALYGASVGAVSREGLLLPAPASASWSDITLPPGASFRAWVGRAATPLAGNSDGAEIIVEFTTGDKTEELGRRKVAGQIKDPEHWTLDLAAAAGKTGTLTVRTTPGDNPDFDYVLVAAPTVVGSDSSEPRHVFVIGIDTLRPDHLGTHGYDKDTSPELDAWAKDAVVFDRAWTSAPRTRPSFRAATTGRRPLDAVCAKNIGQVFDEQGFATAGIVANVHLNPRFDFHKGFDYWWHAGEALIDEQIGRAEAWLEANEGRDTYMFLHIMDPHIFYRAPEPYQSRFTEGLPELTGEDVIPKRFNRHDVYRWMKNNKLSDDRKAHIEAAYDAEVAYTSAELSRFLAKVDALPGKTMVLIHNDHGEEFWEHGGYEHNHTLYDDTTRALMWIKPPGGTGQDGARSQVPATLQDIAPTLYDFAGFPSSARPETDGISLLPAVRGTSETGWTRPIPIGHLRYDADRWGVVYDDHKYVLITGTGEEKLFNLVEDPQEQNNLAGSTDTEPYWRKLATSHQVPVGHGWRINIAIAQGKTATITLPHAAVDANVLDPELITRHPANQVWGERPHKTPAEVADVTLSGDKKTLTIKGGSSGKGTVWVMFDKKTPAGGSVKLGAESSDLSEGAEVSVGGATFLVNPGVLVIPSSTEATRMRSCGTGEDVKGSEMDMLKSLGYVGDEGADGH